MIFFYGKYRIAKLERWEEKKLQSKWVSKAGEKEKEGSGRRRMEGRAGFYQGPDYSWTLTYSDADTCPNALFIGLPLKYSLPPVPLSVSLSLCLTQLLLPCTFLNSRERASHGRSDFNQESALAGDGLAGGQRKPPEWQGHDEKRCLRCHLLHGLRK